MFARWMIVLRCWLSAVLALALVGCAGSRPGSGEATQLHSHRACAVFVDAWVGHFKANVQRLDGQHISGLETRLEQARRDLLNAGVDEQDCRKPMCIIEPKAGGRLDSYCGYRLEDESGAELYRWERWEPSTR